RRHRVPAASRLSPCPSAAWPLARRRRSTPLVCLPHGQGRRQGNRERGRRILQRPDRAAWFLSPTIAWDLPPSSAVCFARSRFAVGSAAHGRLISNSRPSSHLWFLSITPVVVKPNTWNADFGGRTTQRFLHSVELVSSIDTFDLVERQPNSQRF